MFRKLNKMKKMKVSALFRASDAVQKLQILPPFEGEYMTMFQLLVEFTFILNMKVSGIPGNFIVIIFARWRHRPLRFDSASN